MTTATCTAHHWLIATNAGPYSEARCRNCGEERLYGNSEEAAAELSGAPQKYKFVTEAVSRERHLFVEGKAQR